MRVPWEINTDVETDLLARLHPLHLDGLIWQFADFSLLP